MIQWGAAETLSCPADSAPGSLGDLGTLFVLGEVQVSAVQTTGFSAESSTKLALNERQGHRPLQHFMFFVLFCFVLFLIEPICWNLKCSGGNQILI